jgi:hypothetical protein
MDRPKVERNTARACKSLEEDGDCKAPSSFWFFDNLRVFIFKDVKL